jgi:hypothetical protein
MQLYNNVIPNMPRKYKNRNNYKYEKIKDKIIEVGMILERLV